MTTQFFDWPAAATAGPTRAGGKGWQLGRMSALGVPVPAGFVIEAAASVGHPPSNPLPVDLVHALDQALTDRGWRDHPLVVRSSAPLEDSTGVSFAGIYRSCLNVQGLESVCRAVQAVWDSQWTPQALAYRQRLGLADRDTAMAVVVMPLLPAVASGLVFTCDPISGRDDQLIIHAHWGLGEALVSGQVEGDEYRLQESDLDDNLHLIDQQVGSKARLTVPAPGGGVALRNTPADQAILPVLTPAQAIVLGELARDAAYALDYANARYDVEWVWDGERFWIVQARPVTVRGRPTYPALANQPALWSRGNTQEVLPEPLSPLDWGFSRTMVNRMLTRSYALGGYTPLPGVQRAGLFHGRLYLETALMQWEGFDAFGVVPKAMNQLMGGHQPEITTPPPTLRQRVARGLRILRYLRHSARQRRHAEATLAQARERAAAWLAHDLPEDNAALAQQLRHQFAAVRHADDLFFLQGSGGGTLFNLVELVEKYSPGEGHALTAALLAGGEPSLTAAQGYALMELARIAAADAPALAWLRRSDRVGVDWSRELPEDSPFRRTFAEFLKRY
ncbi:MAG: PEP/pyruvate-binding domain-containing protein, partial [Candidatus Competibacteraceae bacterium]|nr:PEP/pyruvate-binding domain-containing protein [Candidatus Competibacteraceae bacterium]